MKPATTTSTSADDIIIYKIPFHSVTVMKASKSDSNHQKCLDFRIGCINNHSLYFSKLKINKLPMAALISARL